VVSTKRILLVVIAMLVALLTTLSLPAQAASVPGKPIAKIISGSSRVVLSWAAPASNGSTITAYQVGARKFAFGKWQAWSYYNLSKAYRSKAVAYTNGTRVQGMVRAKNAKGFGSWSTVQSTTTGLPTAVPGVGTVSGDQQITVNWSAASGNGSAITAYRIYNRSFIKGAWTTWNYRQKSAATFTTTFTNLAVGPKYQYYVRSANRWGYGPGSVTRSAFVAPTPPRGVISRSENKGITVSWTPPDSNGGSPITNYIAKTNPGGATCQALAPATSCTVNGLTNGGTYKATVIANNAFGSSAPGASPAPVIPLGVPDAPPPRASASNGSAKVEWAGRATQISAGWRHSCALLSDGSVKCWGDNTYGQLGTNGSPSSGFVSGITNATQISAGITHTCALIVEGSVKCWGNNEFGQLGNNGGPSPSIVSGITNATQISVSGYHTCALVENGDVKCWGFGGDVPVNDLIGINSTAPVLFSRLASVTRLSSGYRHICAIKEDTSVSCFGLLGGFTFQSIFPEGSITTGATQLTSGGWHTCAVLTDSSVNCWGDGAYGQLGSTSTGSDSPILIRNITDPSQISGSGIHTCAVRRDQTISCWGGDLDGQLGKGITGATGISGVIQVAAGSFHTCALLADGSIECWGLNAQGQRTVPALPKDGGSPIISYTATASPGGNTCTAIAPATSCTVNGLTNGQNYTFVVTALNAIGRSSESAPSANITPATVPNAPTMVSGISRNTQIIANWTPPLSDGGLPITSYTATATPSGNTCSAIAPATSCTIDGLYNGIGYTIRVTAVNAVGTSQASNSSPPITLKSVPGAPTAAHASAGSSSANVLWDSPRATQVGNGDNHTCSLLAGGSLMCWGDDTYGQLGNEQFYLDGFRLSATPVTVSGITNATQISAGGTHTCALLADASIKCWGNNTAGQLGNLSTVPSATPVTVSGITNATQISAGGTHACALLADASINCWGNNTAGQLGNPFSQLGTGFNVNNIYSATQVSLGSQHSCALLIDGAIRCWGYGYFGQIGNGQFNSYIDPSGVIQVSGDGGSPIISFTAVATEDPSRVCTVAPPANSCTVEGLTPGQTYTFTVTATNAIGTSSPSVPSDPVTIP